MKDDYDWDLPIIPGSSDASKSETILDLSEVCFGREKGAKTCLSFAGL